MKAALWVARKELREMFRDKRVRSSAFVMPTILVLVLLALMGFLAETLSKPENQKIHVIGSENSLTRALKAAKVNVIQVDSVEAGEKLIRDGKARLVLKFDPSFDASGRDAQVSTIEAYLNPRSPASAVSLSLVRQAVGKMNRETVAGLLTKEGIAANLAEPRVIKENEVKVGESNASDFLVSMLPYLITIWAFYGGFATGSELVAGEKEKNTLETLLITPIRRREIASGKFLALMVVCYLSSVSSLIGVLIAGLSGLSIFRAVFPEGLGIGVTEITVILLSLIPAVAFFASVLLAISTLAKNSREAQQYLSLASLVVLLPALFSQFIGYTDIANARWVSAVPILNTAVSLRQALLGKVDWVGLGITVGMSTVLAAIAIFVVMRLFEREEVLARV